MAWPSATDVVVRQLWVDTVWHCGSGGGADRLARLIQSIIEKNDFSPLPFIPVNKPDGSEAETLHQSLIISHGSPITFIERALSAISIVAAVIFLAYPIYRMRWRARAAHTTD